jgi:hypothetical protein
MRNCVAVVSGSRVSASLADVRSPVVYVPLELSNLAFCFVDFGMSYHLTFSVSLKLMHCFVVRLFE